jgi:SSS family solute:Na+ symporter/sodium/proline symporter
MNFWKSRRVKSQDDMMLAGRRIPVYKMVFTLICTWIGSGTFIAGAEFAAKAGWSSLWQPAGAWIGIIIIYFLAAKIRTFGQYTVGDILEERYGPVARIFGALAIIVSFTVIVSYQFKAGGYILNAISDGAISTDQGLFMAAAFVIIFTFVGGMIAIANTDLPNGIIILSSTVISTPLVILAAGGWSKIKAVLPASHFQAFSPEFGANPALKIPAIGISTLLLLLGVQSLYQKFYSARNPREAKKAAGIWVIGTIIVEGVAIVIAVFASSYFWQELQAGTMDHAAVIVQAAKKMIFLPVGVLLLGAATAVVISTGMNYLLSPTTNIMRDIYQRFIKPDADQARMVALQKVFVVILGVCAFLMIFIPTVLHARISVLRYSYFAYTMYGVAITPALLAALAWRRATRLGGLVSIVSGALCVILLDIVVPRVLPQVMRGDDPWGIPSIYPSALVSIGSLVLVSLLTPPPTEAELAPLFKKDV